MQGRYLFCTISMRPGYHLDRGTLCDVYGRAGLDSQVASAKDHDQPVGVVRLGNCLQYCMGNLPSVYTENTPNWPQSLLHCHRRLDLQERNPRFEASYVNVATFISESPSCNYDSVIFVEKEGYALYVRLVCLMTTQYE
jgi:hypothetical protein